MSTPGCVYRHQFCLTISSIPFLKTLCFLFGPVGSLESQSFLESSEISESQPDFTKQAVNPPLEERFKLKLDMSGCYRPWTGLECSTE